MQVKINVSRDIVEDGFISALRGSHRVSRLTGSFVMDQPDGFCSSPFRIGQAIRLKPSSCPIYIEKHSNIVYDVVSKSWNIILPRWYICDFDNRTPQIMKSYGFDKIEAIQKDKITQQSVEKKQISIWKCN
jgi:hypothetical protein